MLAQLKNIEKDLNDINHLPDEALIRQSSLISKGLIPFSPTTLWRKCKQGDFPQPIKISKAITAWRVGQIREWLNDPQGYKSNQRRVAGSRL
jgi:prophage regulatory protein